MTRRLILMRHAKSDWSADRSDHERPLNPRGRRAAKSLGDWLRAQALEPDQILCSTSARTIETCDRLGLRALPDLSGKLYLAPPEVMAFELRRARGETVLMIAHNPGIAEFAAGLVAAPPDHIRFADYPTGATTVMEFAANDWQDIAPGSGAVLDFVTPADLA